MTKIDISHYVERTRVLGPYERSALWVHGCCFNCEGCIAKEMNLQESKEVNTAELIELFAGIRDAEGITISGGEPFLQAESLLELVRGIKNIRDYGVIVYTGFEIEELLMSKEKFIHKFLEEIDVLIDGKYIEAFDDGKAYRGSSNQRILKLSDRYNIEFENYYSSNEKRNIEINVTGNNVYMVGVPSSYGLETWRKFKKKAGCESD